MVLEFISTTKHRIDACLDHTRPSLISEIQDIRQFLTASGDRGIKTRFITEITNDNISHCKATDYIG